MSAESNKALVRRFYEEIDKGNLAAMDELVAEDYVDHNPAPFGFPSGREGLKQAFALFLKATPGYLIFLSWERKKGDKNESANICSTTVWLRFVWLRSHCEINP